MLSDQIKVEYIGAAAGLLHRLRWAPAYHGM